MVSARLFVFIFLLICAGAWAQLTEEQVKKQWEEYYSLSKLLHRDDLKQIGKELKSKGKDTYESPKYARDFGFGKYDMTPEFLKSDEGKGIIEIILSYQTPSGGWSKEVDMTKNKRRKAESYGEDMNNYVPTFDTNATTLQLEILAKAVSATRDKKARNAFLRGLGLIFNAQFPNGGFPQGYPLSGGYHDYITYNDRAMVNVLNILLAVANGEEGYAFVPSYTQKRANEAFLKGLNCILMTQVNVNGKYTAWAAQYDQFQLKPAKARAYEPPSLASLESVDIVLLMMSLKNPPGVVVQAIDDAVKWFKATKITGYRWDQELGILIKDKTAEPLWARFYDVETNEPIFGDRNGKVYKDVNEVSKERRINYSWYTTSPIKVLNKHASWRKSVVNK